MKKLLTVMVAITLLGVSVNHLNAKRVYIVVDNAKLRQSLIAIPPLKNLKGDPIAEKHGRKLRDVIRSDMTFSGLFDFIDPKDMTPFEGKGFETKEVNFKEWSALGAEFLIKGGYEFDEGRLSLNVRLFDVKSGRMILGKKYSALQAQMRSLAHRFSNAVMLALTGDKGIFETKILFVSNKTGFKELYRMDFDGENIEQLTSLKSIVLSPSWSFNGKKILYSSYRTHKKHIKNLDLSVLELATKKHKAISTMPGLNSGAAWAPDGWDIALTMSYEGNPEIYLVRPNGRNRRRITKHGAIDVEADWSPDGNMLAFSSGRAPSAHLFVMDKRGGSLKRLTYAGRYNSSPSWSPKGNQIAFAGQRGGSFDLYMIKPDGNALRRLTKALPGRHNENPSFSPDGRHIVFTSNRTGRYGLYIINEDGSGERPLLTNFGQITTPEWSPYFK